MHPRIARKEVSREPYVNLVGVYGHIVHAPEKLAKDLTACSLAMRSVRYTDEPVTCPDCRKTVG